MKYLVPLALLSALFSVPVVQASATCAFYQGEYGRGCVYVGESGCMVGVGVIEDPNSWKPFGAACDFDTETQTLCAVAIGADHSICVFRANHCLNVAVNKDEPIPLVCL